MFKDSFAIKHTDIDLCKNKLQNLLKSKRYIAYIVEEDKKLIGSCVVYIHNVPFDKDFQSFGILRLIKNVGINE